MRSSAHSWGYLFIAILILVTYLTNDSFLSTIASFPGRPSIILSCLVCLLFSPVILKAYFKIAHEPWWFSVPIFYITIQPIIVFGLLAFDIRYAPQTISAVSPFLSGASWSMTAMAFTTAYTFLRFKDLRRIFTLLFVIISLIAVECVISFHLLDLPYVIDELGYFNGGLFRVGDAMASRSGLMLIPLSFFLFCHSTNSHRRVFLAGIPLGIVLAISTGSRPSFGTALIMVAALTLTAVLTSQSVRGKRRVLVNTVVALIIVGVLASAGFVVASKIRHGKFTSTHTLWTRTITWSRGLELGMDHFPLGLGGGLLGYYNADETLSFSYPEDALEFFGDPGGSQSLKIDWYSRMLPSMTNHSIHSVHVAIAASFGLAGLVVIAAMVIAPLRALPRTLKKNRRGSPVGGETAIAISLICIQLALLTESVNAILPIFALLYLPLRKEYLDQENPQ